MQGRFGLPEKSRYAGVTFHRKWDNKENPVIYLLSCAWMLRRAFASFANMYVFFVALTAIVLMVAAVTVAWMASTNSVSPELLQQVGPVSRTSQDPRVEPHIPLNVELVSAFREVSVLGWEFEFESDQQEERLLHTLGLLSLHNGGTYRVEPMTAPVEFISALEEASQEGVAGVERFLVSAGRQPSWREAEYGRYETVVIDLVPSTIEEYLLKGFVMGGMAGVPMLTCTIVLLSRRRRTSGGESGDSSSD